MSKIAVLDTSFITNWKSPDKTKEEQEKYDLFENLIKQKKIIIAIPTPVITELLSGPVKKVSNEVLGKNIKVLPFDYRASIECADIFGYKNKQKEPEGSKAKIKFDCQIIAIAKANNITTIYTDDEQLTKRAKKLGIEVISSEELPLEAQPSLF
ncbi:PIN domain-containing protein [Methanobrevibacter smithii]|jgi:hypothetical protein|uniref:PIN domain-containing protein n=1 Tax=Methanobrevibacter smithii TaxID=2173 RepID=UPI0037DC6424